MINLLYLTYQAKQITDINIVFTNKISNFLLKMEICLVILLFSLSISNSQECGNPIFPPKPRGGERIINGEEAIPHSFPWMVSIKGKFDPHYCGASILSPNWVLTAAHCGNIVFIGEYAGDEVAIGAHERETAEEGTKKPVKPKSLKNYLNYRTRAILERTRI